MITHDLVCGCTKPCVIMEVRVSRVLGREWSD
jgi:hypothetical protein